MLYKGLPLTELYPQSTATTHTTQQQHIVYPDTTPSHSPQSHQNRQHNHDTGTEATPQLHTATQSMLIALTAREPSDLAHLFRSHSRFAPIESQIARPEHDVTRVTSPHYKHPQTQRYADRHIYSQARSLEVSSIVTSPTYRTIEANSFIASATDLIRSYLSITLVNMPQWTV